MERFTTVSIQNERPKNKGMNGEKIKSILQSKPTGQQCSAQGWVRTFRANRFIALNDGSTIENLQCVVDFEQLDESVLKQITTGAALHLQGELVESQGSGQKVDGIFPVVYT